MTHRNPNIAQLSSNYLFPEINRRKQEFLKAHPKAKLISLGIGDTSEPLPDVIADALSVASKGLGTTEGYHGYGPEQGNEVLRKAIAEKIYHNRIDANDIFISDGAKCDLGRLQTLFGSNVTIALQDPTYPVYLDGSIIQGVKNIITMPCHPENGFNPDIAELKEKPDIIYWCSPNNPTGATSTKQQLKQLVDFATKNKSLIVFDAAYASYIRDKDLPRSIFEIEGADKVAIELGSFSKLAGFSGVRLSWSVVSPAAVYNDGTSVRSDWKRVVSTIFNGASCLSQAGGLAALSTSGLVAIRSMNDFYMENVRILRKALEKSGYECHGGENAPYLWVRVPGMNSWEAFQYFMDKAEIVTTPGSGFGSSGEGFLRVSAFGHRAAIAEAADRIVAIK